MKEYFDDDWLAISNKQAVAAAYIGWNNLVFQEAVNLLTVWSSKYHTKLEYEFSFADYMTLISGLRDGEMISEEDAYARLKFLSTEDVIDFFRERERNA